MGNVRKTIKGLSKRIMKSLKQIPEHVEIKGGTEVEILPKPVWRLFFDIQLFRSIARKRTKKKSGNRTKGNKRLHSDDESARK